MSDELRLGLTISFEKGGAKLKRAEHIEVDVAGDAFVHNIQTITTSNVALVETAAIGTPGYVFVKNLNTSTYLDVGITGSYTARLLALQWCIFPAAAAVFVVAEAADTDVEYIIFEL